MTKEHWAVIKTRRLQELGLVPHFTGRGSQTKAVLHALNAGLLDSTIQINPDGIVYTNPDGKYTAVTEPGNTPVGHRLGGAIKTDKSWVIDAAWEFLQGLFEPLKALQDQAEAQQEEEVERHIRGLRWLLEMVQLDLEAIQEDAKDPYE